MLSSILPHAPYDLSYFWHILPHHKTSPDAWCSFIEEYANVFGGVLESCRLVLIRHCHGSSFVFTALMNINSPQCLTSYFLRSVWTSPKSKGFEAWDKLPSTFLTFSEGSALPPEAASPSTPHVHTRVSYSVDCGLGRIFPRHENLTLTWDYCPMKCEVPCSWATQSQSLSM